MSLVYQINYNIILCICNIPIITNLATFKHVLLLDYHKSIINFKLLTYNFLMYIYFTNFYIEILYYYVDYRAIKYYWYIHFSGKKISRVDTLISNINYEPRIILTDSHFYFVELHTI